MRNAFLIVAFACTARDVAAQKAGRRVLSGAGGKAAEDRAMGVAVLSV